MPAVTLAHGSVVLGASSLGSQSVEDAVDLARDLLSPGLPELAGFAGVDTSNNYAEGRSEQALGRAIAAGGVPDGVLLMTKVDADPESGRFDGDRVRQSVEESLGRLGLDRVPLLHLHDPHSLALADALAAGGAVPALVRLREEGVVDAIGVATGPPELVQAYVSTGIFDAVLSHNCLTLVNRTAEPVFADARARGMTVLNAAPFGGGILAGSQHHGGTYAYRPAAPDLLQRVAELGEICLRHGVSLAAAALAFSMRHPLVDATVVGISSLRRLEQLRTLVSTRVPDALLEELDELESHDGRDGAGAR